MRELNLVTNLHQATKRDYLGRMNDSKVQAMIIAKKYGQEYWDGERRFGYGGYHYIPGRWESVARRLIEIYSLKAGSRVLDVGCGKGFLLYEMQLIEPGLEIHGFDISQYGLDKVHPNLNANLIQHSAQEPFPYPNKYFDLVISLGTLHNLHIYELAIAISEIERVAKQSYIMVESYRNELEMFNLECWALTAESLMDVDEWIWIYNHFGYSGDYEFIYFE